MAALKKDVEKKRGKVEDKIEQEILFLSDRVREVEEEMETEDATFLQVKLQTYTTGSLLNTVLFTTEQNVATQGIRVTYF